MLRNTVHMNDVVQDSSAVKSVPSTPDFRSSIITAKNALENNKKAKDIERLAIPNLHGKSDMRTKIEAAQRAFLTEQSKKQAIAALKAELKYEIIDNMKEDLRNGVVGDMKNELRSEVVAELKAQHEQQVMTQLKEELREQAVAELKQDILHGDKKDIRLELFNNVTAALDAEYRIPAQKVLKEEIDEEFRTKWEAQLRDDTIEEIRADLGPRIQDQLHREMHAALEKQKAYLERMFMADLLAEWSPQLEAKLRRYMAVGDNDRRRASFPESVRENAHASGSRSNVGGVVDLTGEERLGEANHGYRGFGGAGRPGFYVDKLTTTDKLAHGLPDDDYFPAPHVSSVERGPHLTKFFARVSHKKETLFVSEDEADIEDNDDEDHENVVYNPTSPTMSPTSPRYQPGDQEDNEHLRSERELTEEYAGQDDRNSQAYHNNPRNGSYDNGDDLPDYEDSDDEQSVNHIPNPHYPYGLRAVPAADHDEFDGEETLHEPAITSSHHIDTIEYDEEQTIIGVEDPRLGGKPTTTVNVLKRSRRSSFDEEDDEFGITRPHGPSKRLREEYHGGTNDAATHAELREHAHIEATRESEEESTEIETDSEEDEDVQGALKGLAPFGAYARYGMAEFGVGEEGYGFEEEEGEGYDEEGEGEAGNQQSVAHDLRGTSENNAIDLDSD